MFGLARFSVLALALSASAFAGPHSRQKRRHHHADRHVEERSGGNSTHTLSKRAFNGRGTFYDVGLGACGQYSQPSDYMVALNSAQYGGGYPGPQCFKTITIQCNGVTVSGVTIMDECPTCPYGGLDLSRGLFSRFADESVGVIQLTWWFEGDAPAPAPTTSQWVEPSPTWSPSPSTQAPSPTPTTTWTPPPSSTSVWVAPSSTSTWVAPSSSSAAPSSTWSSSTSTYISTSLAPSSSTYNSTNPFAIIATDNSTATSTSLSVSASASASAASTEQVVQSSTQGNLVAINGLVAAYGQLIVTGAGGYE